MKRLLIVTSLLLAFCLPAHGLEYIKDRDSYQRLIPQATDSQYTMALIQNLYQFLITRHGVSYRDWLEARQLAISCDAVPHLYGSTPPPVTPGYAADRTGTSTASLTQAMRQRLYATNWAFQGYEGCGEITHHNFMFFVRIPASGGGDTPPIPETVGARLIELRHDTTNNDFILTYKRENMTADGAQTRTLILNQIGGNAIVEGSNTEYEAPSGNLAMAFDQVEALVLAEDGIRLDLSLNNGVTLSPHASLVQHMDWIRTVIDHARLYAFSYSFRNGVPERDSMTYAISADGRTLHVDVARADNLMATGDVISRFQIRRDNTHFFVLLDGAGNRIDTASNARQIASRLANRF